MWWDGGLFGVWCLVSGIWCLRVFVLVGWDDGGVWVVIYSFGMGNIESGRRITFVILSEWLQIYLVIFGL